jgi:hypothetical protein
VAESTASFSPTEGGSVNLRGLRLLTNRGSVLLRKRRRPSMWARLSDWFSGMQDKLIHAVMHD